VNQGKILLVEDSRDDVELTLRAFKSNNIKNEIVVAADGVQALEFLYGADGKKLADPLPSIVLLDLNLPRVNGLEVLQRIRAHDKTRTLPVVILTSSTEERDLVEGYKLGANSYVRKPVDFAEFTQAARQLGLYWLLLNRTPAAGDRV
jgi:two-component system response regulator